MTKDQREIKELRKRLDALEADAKVCPGCGRCNECGRGGTNYRYSEIHPLWQKFRYEETGITWTISQTDNTAVGFANMDSRPLTIPQDMIDDDHFDMPASHYAGFTIVP